MARKQKYPLNKISKNYTYTVKQIADLYGICDQTVFRWIKNEGLKRNKHSRKYLIHGSQLYRFLLKRNGKRKKPCNANEIFCMKCQAPRLTKSGSLEYKNMANKSIRVIGQCKVCGTRMNKAVGLKNWSKKHPFYPEKTATKPQHNGEHKQQRKCHPKIGEQYCLITTP